MAQRNGCTLGCNPEYEAFITDRGGTPKLSQVPLPVTSGKWSRLLDGVSSASVDLALGDAPECCGMLANVRTWRHELVIYRNSDRVWEGPLSLLKYGRKTATLNALDVTAWLGRRTHHSRITMTEDASRIAEAIVVDALRVDDPNILPHLEVRASGRTVRRDYTSRSAYALDSLTELAKTMVDFTTLGRKIIIGGPLTFGKLAELNCDHFAADVQVIEDGGAAATGSVVLGGGVTGVAGHSAALTSDVVSSGGGVDFGYYGLIETLVKDDNIKDADSAKAAAEALLWGTSPPPLFVAPVSGSALTENAPVCIQELVPGVLVPVRIDCTCRPSRALLRLVGLNVSWNRQNEQVQPVFETPTVE